MKKSIRGWLFLSALLAAVACFALATGSAAAHPDCEEDSKEIECLEHEFGSFDLGEELTDEQPGSPVGDAVGTFESSPNMTALGYSARNVPFSGPGNGQFNSDLAFQGNLAYQGTYAGFRVIDVSDPANPVQLHNDTSCSVGGGQGDVVVYGNILVRAWDAPVTSANAATASCGGQLVGVGFEGVHIFDVSNPKSPVLVKRIRMASTGSGPVLPGGSFTSGCGSHTLSLVPDVARGNVYVYSSASSTACTGVDIIRIPLTSPGDAGLLRRVSSGNTAAGLGPARACHDTTIITGTANLVSCAGGNGFSMYRFDPSLSPGAAGGIENPTLLYSRPVTGVTIGHSSAFSNDGKILIYGHEPGGGSAARCQTTSTVVERSLYFFDALTNTQLGTLVQPRPQTATENCTWHNFNVVPTNRAHVAVVGSYQMGITVIDFTDPANAQQIAYADPAPLASTLVLGGDWSTYWHNGKIYESDIRRGLMVWDLDDRRVKGAKTLALSNPQTQELVFDLDRTKPRVVSGLPASIGLGKSVAAAYTCVDDQGPETSGIFSCTGSIAVGGNLDSSSVGTKTLTVTAEDGAGNVTTATFTYEVIWDRFSGFLRPIGESENSGSAGQAVPVKFTLGADYGLNVIAEGYPRTKACGAADDTAVAAVAVETLGYFDGQYKWTWKTDKAWSGTCRELIVKLADNTIHRATYRFK
jgi:hypothetical protein